MDTKSPIKILLVEDDEDDYFIIKDYLSNTYLPYEITWAVNYASFLTHINHGTFDLVITDYLLGNTSGIEVLKKVKEKDAFIPVMLLTGKGNTSIDMEAMKLGASDYLVKGYFDASTIERAVRYSIEQANNVRIVKENETYQNTLNKIISTDRISRMIAHEVKNPLTNILLCAEQMKEFLPHNEEFISYLQIITRNSQRINQLVTNLMDSTRFGDIKLEECNLIELLGDTLVLVEDRLKLKSVKIVEDYSHPVIQLAVDAEKLKIALVNIIINAIEVLEENPDATITIKIEKLTHHVRIRIRDNGRGIPPEIKDKLFEPFFTSKETGSGLGLASAQNIILGHKGKIELNNELTEGAEFIISFSV
ncbi:MAG: hybrid sensor histidine kinase/response regulator [Bacteroidota bacterium]